MAQSTNTRIFVNGVGLLFQEVIEKTEAVQKLEQDLKDAADLYAKYQAVAEYVENSKTFIENVETTTSGIFTQAQSELDAANEALTTLLKDIYDNQRPGYDVIKFIEATDDAEAKYELDITDDFDYSVFIEDPDVEAKVAAVEAAQEKLDKANIVYDTIKALAERIDDVLTEDEQAIRDKLVDEINKEYVDNNGDYLETVDSNTIADYEIQLQLEIIERCIRNYYAEVVKELNDARIELEKATSEFEQMLLDLGVDVDGGGSDDMADNDSKEAKIKAMLDALKAAVDTLNESGRQVNISVGDIFGTSVTDEAPALDDDVYEETEANAGNIADMKNDYIEEYNDTNLDGIDDNEKVQGQGFNLDGIWYENLEDYKAKNPWDADLSTYTSRVEMADYKEANPDVTDEQIAEIRQPSTSEGSDTSTESGSEGGSDTEDGGTSDDENG